MMKFRKYAPGSLRMAGMTTDRAWITKPVEIRFSRDNVDRPITKWALVRFNEVEMTPILRRNALIGTGPLHDWLRGKSAVTLHPHCY